MANAADRYQDALIQHGVELQGVSNSLVAQMIAVLNRTERDLVAQLRDGAEILGVGTGADIIASKAVKLEEMIAAVVLIRDVAWKQLHGNLRDELLSLAKFESAFNKTALDDAIAILEVQLGSPTATQLRRVVNQDPFRGKNLRGWTTALRGADLSLLRDTIISAVAEGASVDDLITRVRGTRKLKFTDGVFQGSRLAVANIVRTAVSHVQNGVREEVFSENADFFDGLVWISTLDGKTSRICAALDGHVAPKPGVILPSGRIRLNPPGRRPPAHLGGCRSLMGAWFRAVGIVGTRPFVTSTLGRRDREINFRREARDRAGAKWATLSRSQRNAKVRSERSLWAEENIGSLPAETSFSEFFERSPVSFQKSWLGPTRFKLFADGGLKINSFVDLQTGKQLTVDQLIQIHREAFQKAGLL